MLMFDKDPNFKKYRHDDVQMVILSAVPVALKIQEIESVSAEDEELQAVPLVKTKEQLTSKVWWLGVDKDAERPESVMIVNL